jgi:hypothetical protein
MFPRLRLCWNRASKLGRPQVASIVALASLASAAMPGQALAGAPTAQASSITARTRADNHVLAASTHALELCLHHRPHSCAAQAKAVRKAASARRSDRHALAAYYRSWGSSVAAPVIKVSGETLSWNQIGSVTSYGFVRKSAGLADKYTTIKGMSITPTPIPGATVYYSVRAEVNGAPWAHEVAITYPSAPPVVTPPASSVSTPPASSVETTGPSGGGTSGSGSSGGGASETGSGGSGSEAGGAVSEPGSEDFGLPFVKGIDANLSGEGNNDPEDITEMRSLGVSWTREDLPWSEVEPQKGVFNWSSFDRLVKVTKEFGISVLPIVGYAPSWTSPTNAAAYAEFVAAAVARYGPGTSANIQWWELWNEPYFAYAWSGKTPEPEAYARDFAAAAEAAKAVAPGVKLLIAADYQESAQTGGTSPEEKTWVNDMFTAVPSLGKWVSGISVHPYGGDPSLPLREKGGYLDTSGQWGFQRIDTIREKFLAHSVNVPFWITEEGWSTWEVSEATLAKNYTDLLTQVKLRPWVRALFPFGFRENAAHPTNNQPGFALLKYGTHEPKTGWNVLKEGLPSLS